MHPGSTPVDFSGQCANTALSLDYVISVSTAAIVLLLMREFLFDGNCGFVNQKVTGSLILTQWILDLAWQLGLIDIPGVCIRFSWWSACLCMRLRLSDSMIGIVTSNLFNSEGL